jgi:membrane protein
MKLSGKQALRLFKSAGADWMNDHAPRLGAALAFYTIFSLAPLLTITISIAALWFSENASHQIFTELGNVIGSENAKGLQEMLNQPGKEKQGWFAAISSVVMLCLGATGVFVQLQDSLNAIWEVKPKPGRGIWGFIRHRLLSFAMVLGIAFLLLVSLLLTAGLAAIGRYFSHIFGDMTWLWQAINTIVSFGLVTLLFALMFKYMPDAKVAWKDVWVGAFVTAILFTIGKFGLGMYLGKSSVVSTYSVAGALIVTLLWVYYSSQIVFFGAELTQAYAHEFGRGVQPAEYAERDHAQEMAKKAAADDRERCKAAKEAKKHPPQRPVPAFIPAHAGTGKFGKTLGGALLLALVLWPFERKRLGGAKA